MPTVMYIHVCLQALPTQAPLLPRALPAVLRAVAGPSHGSGEDMVDDDPAELSEVMDLTADDIVTIDVEHVAHGLVALQAAQRE